MTVRNDRPQFEAEVTAVSRVSPHMVRVALGGIRGLDGSRMPEGGVSDEFFGLWVPGAGADALNGRVKRYYTVRRRRADAGELDVDLLLHGTGPATEWAARAAVGDVVMFDSPRGHYAPPSDSTRLVLCGDATALPAIGRMLEERAEQDSSPPASILIALDDRADAQLLPIRPGDDLCWCSPKDLVAGVRSRIGDDSRSYVWFSGEAADMRAVRAMLRRELNIPTARWMTMGYWRRDSERWSARFEAAGPELRIAIDEVLSSSVDDETQSDLLEELLAARGLL